MLVCSLLTNKKMFPIPTLNADTPSKCRHSDKNLVLYNANSKFRRRKPIFFLSEIECGIKSYVLFCSGDKF